MQIRMNAGVGQNVGTGMIGTFLQIAREESLRGLMKGVGESEALSCSSFCLYKEF